MQLYLVSFPKQFPVYAPYSAVLPPPSLAGKLQLERACRPSPPPPPPPSLIADKKVYTASESRRLFWPWEGERGGTSLAWAARGEKVNGTIHGGGGRRVERGSGFYPRFVAKRRNFSSFHGERKVSSGRFFSSFPSPAALLRREGRLRQRGFSFILPASAAQGLCRKRRGKKNGAESSSSVLLLSRDGEGLSTPLSFLPVFAVSLPLPFPSPA